jgi:hypothetical protein
MMKSMRIGCLCIFISLFAAGLQAASVTWDVGPSGAAGSYSIPFGYNGGSFYYLTSPNYSNIQYGGPQSSSSIGVPVTDTRTETFGANPGTIDFYLMGGGGTHADGVVNQAEARITKTDMDGNQYIAYGQQEVVSDVFRSFSADPGAQVTVSADITGLIDWVDEVDENYNWVGGYPEDDHSPHASYRIDAKIDLLPMSLSGNSISADIPDPIILDKKNLSGSISFLADNDTDIYYRLTAHIALDTRVQNLYPALGYGPLGPLPDVGDIDTLMTTTVSQAPVPIPGSLVLLLSGCLSLVTLRKRRMV